jgi:hypothetical protein
MMKKQLILSVVLALVCVVSLGSRSAFAGYQPGFSLIISPVVFSAPRSHHFGTSYVYTQYPARPIKTIGMVNSYHDREVVYVKHVEPLRINKYRSASRHYNRHW